MTVCLFVCLCVSKITQILELKGIFALFVFRSAFSGFDFIISKQVLVFGMNMEIRLGICKYCK